MNQSKSCSKLCLWFAGVGATLGIIGTPAKADVGQGMEEVIVTATKRAESKQDIPIAISVLGSEEITNSNANNIKDIVGLIPNMTFEAGNNSATADISIRGIYNQVQAGAIGYESGLSVYVDGVSTGNQFNANQNLGEIERVEVLRGPQGTLFGKNSIAGAINIITKKPTNELAGRVSVELGDRSLEHFQGNLNIPFNIFPLMMS